MSYQSYKQARDAAWQVLIDCHIRQLPVDIGAICKQCGYKVYSYQSGKQAIAQMGLSNQCNLSDGFTLSHGKNIYIFYNDRCSHGRQRFTLAHELGHIILGHLLEGSYTTVNREPSPNDSPEETQANQFAARVLAPACVLYALGATNAEDISRLCDISIQAAKFRAHRLGVLANRGKYFSHPLERQVFAQFTNYLSSLRP